MTTLMICGYRGTGKDTLADAITSTSEVKRKYYLYTKSDALINNLIVRTPRHRTKFAAALKESVRQQLRVDVETWNSMMILKDSVKICHPETGETKFMRQWLVDEGTSKRLIDPNYWIKQVVLDSEHTIIDDWRFVNEAEEIRKRNTLLTLRIWRSSLSEPPMSALEEHDLDAYITDGLILNHPDELPLALKRFPQMQHLSSVEPLIATSRLPSTPLKSIKL